MDAGCDIVEKLLQTTGLSCDDLLNKLQQYRSKKSQPIEKDSNLSKDVDSNKELCSSHEMRCENTKETKTRKNVSSLILEAIEMQKNKKKATQNVIDLENSESDVSNNDTSYFKPYCDQVAAKNDIVTVSPKRFNSEDELKLGSQSLENSESELQKEHTNLEAPDIERNKSVEEAKTSENQEEKQGLTLLGSFVPTAKKSLFLSSNIFHSEETTNISNNEGSISKDLEEDKEKEVKEKSTEVFIFKPPGSTSTPENISEGPTKTAEIVLEEETNNEEKTLESQDLNTKKTNIISNDSNSIFSEEDQNESDLSMKDFDASESEDNLRNILRKQLSSLRNMKKCSEILPDLKKTSTFLSNLNKKRKSCDANKSINESFTEEAESLVEEVQEEMDTKTENIEDENVIMSTDKDTTEKEEVENESEKLSSNENSVVSLSDETEFIILDVSGGVDRLTESEAESLDEEDTSCISTSNTDESKIKETRIKAHKNKKLKANLDRLLPQTKRNQLQLSVRKNMSENFDQDPGVNKSVKNSEKSPFVSDSLEDFLNENAELRISYAIPKLGAEDGICEKTKKSPFDNVANCKNFKIEQQIVPKEKPKFKAKTLAEMRRQMLKQEAQEKDPIPRKKFKEFIPKKNERNIDKNDNALPRNNYLFVNNEKIWVSSKSDALGLFSKFLHLRKPSILSSLDRAQTYKVKYKPGPLCKKPTLQDEKSRTNWITEVKSLPKIYLEVVPEFRKALDPKVLHLLPIFNKIEIDEERANFALTALQPKDDSKYQSFCFLVPYKNNQDQIVLRRSCIPKSTEQPIEADDPETEITKLVDALINYVETKEIADSLIQDDFVESNETDSQDHKRSRPKLLSKRKKLCLELRRLNCKVIDVANENENPQCSKSFCRLGCVCKSLLCENVFPNHCRKIDCMFECKCPKVSEEVEANKLSELTVNHLEDKAKKNLAKVEKEFTQTFIQTDDQAILVATAKMRRSLKPPKKFTDYIKDDFEIPNQENELPKLKNCDVVLEDVDVKHIVPYCLTHHLYDCHCKGEEIPVKQAEIPKLRIMKTKDDQYVKVETNATIQKGFPEYEEKNKDLIYNTKLQKKLKRRRERLKREKLEQVVEMTDPLSIEGPKIASKPNKRKQSFHIRQDVPLVPVRTPKVKSLPKPDKKEKNKQEQKEFALQRRKKKPKGTYFPVFDGEIKLSLKDNQDLFKIIGNKNGSSPFLRILPWNYLVENYKARRISIWSKDTQPSALLCNRLGYLPPKNFKDIDLVREKNEIISWILTDSLPPDRPRDLMHVILTPKNIHFLIAGYCLRKHNDVVALPNELSMSDSEKIDHAEAKKPLPPLILIESASKPQKYTKVENLPKLEIKNTIFKTANIIIKKKQIQSNANKKEVLKLPVGTSLVPVTSKCSNQTTPRKDVSFLVKSPPKSLVSDTGIPTIQQILNQSLNSVKVSKVGEKRVIATALCEPPKKKVFIETDQGKRKLICEPLLFVETDLGSEPGGSGLVLSKKHTKKPTPMDLNNVPDLEVFEIKSDGKKDKNKLLKDGLIPNRSLKCSHKDMLNKNKILVLTNKTFPEHSLYYHEGTKREQISVSLPAVSKNVKWRMIYLNSDFTFLNFVECNYSIKYTDLMDVVKFSNESQSTVILRNKEFTQHYKHPLFGIYCVPNMRSRLFIGPYLSIEDHGIETLRYLQGDLIKTQIFISMVGRTSNVKQPVWVFDANPFKGSNETKETIIDITQDEEIEVVEVDQTIDSDNTEPVFSDSDYLENSFLCPPFVQVLNHRAGGKKFCNRCVLTNIPQLGYFEAHQGVKNFDIFLPPGKTYRFPSTNLAKAIFQQHLTQIFCPIPNSFKIKVLIMTTAAKSNYSLADSKYFLEPGPYFCGYFGICRKDNVPKKALEQFKINSIGAYLRDHQNSNENEDTMLKILSLFLMNILELKKHLLPHEILKWAKSEIYILEKLEQNYLSEKKDLKNMIDKRSREFRDKLKQFRETIKKSETIEIPDSDEERDEGSNKSGKIETTTSQAGKSLLKPNFLLSAGQSQLNSSDSSDTNAVKITLQNRKYVLKNNALLVTKIT